MVATLPDCVAVAVTTPTDTTPAVAPTASLRIEAWSSACTFTEPPALDVPAKLAVLAVVLDATDTAAPTPTKPPAPEIARLSTAGTPSLGVRLPD